MDSCVGNTVCYCCIWRGGRVLYSYKNSRDHEIENLAALCLEMTPPHHKWYFQTMGKHTFGFLMDVDGYVFFAIVYESLGNSQLLRFLHKLRDEFGKRASSTSSSSSSTSSKSVSNLMTSLCLQEQLLPVVRRLVASLEQHVTNWPAEVDQGEAVPSPCDYKVDNGSSTKAPLLGKPSKQEKKKMKDHAIAIEMGEHRRSTDRGLRIDSTEHGTSASSSSSSSQLRKDNGSSSARINKSSSTQNLQRKKWCRQVRIVLAIDAAVCIVLFVIWLVICHGIECMR